MNRPYAGPGFHTLLFAAFLLAGSLRAAPAAAEIFYTFHPSIDALVEINTETGVATNLGFVGGPVTAAGGAGVAMEYQGGTLSWTNHVFEPPVTFHRATADPITYLGSVPCTGGSPAARRVAGMTWNGSTLLVSYVGCSGCPASYVGELSPAGVLSNSTDFSAFGVSLDLLASGPDGTLLALQDSPTATPPSGRLVRLQRPVAALEVLGDIPHAAGSPSMIRYTGFDFTDSGALWILQRNDLLAWTMRRIDPSSGAVLQDVPITYDTPYSSAAFVGLAHVPSPPVPAGTTSWGRLKSTYRD